MYKILQSIKVVALISVICLSIISCKKDNVKESQHDLKPYTVRFNVNGFSQNSGVYKSSALKVNSVSADSLKTAINVLYYLVYKNNNRYRSIVQHASDPNFGTITDSFDAGEGSEPNNYKVVIIAGKTNLTHLYTVNNPTPDFDEFKYVSNGLTTFFDDTFYKSISFTTPDSVYNFTLDRSVAQLQVKLKDAVPINAKQISLTFKDYQSIYASNGLPKFDTDVQRTVTMNVTPGTIGTVLSTILLNTLNPFSVEIKCSDAANNVIAVKTVSGVTCRANETTVLTGNLFGSGGTNFNVTYNPAWGAPIVKPF
jgi:hypothetical protein